METSMKCMFHVEPINEFTVNENMNQKSSRRCYDPFILLIKLWKVDNFC